MSHKLLYFTSYFLKRLEKYNFPNINQLIALSELGSIAGAGNIDRLNYSQSPLYINTINVPLARNISLEECFYNKAIELSKIKETKKILWSGGIDSTALLVSLILNDKDFNYKIICRESSIKEYPLFYEKWVSKMNHEIRTDKTSIFFNDIFKDSLVITGYCGDCLVCNYDVVKDTSIELNEPWQKVMKLVTREKDLVYDIIEQHIKHGPVPIKTTNDLYLWLNFLFDWQEDTYKVTMRLDDPKKTVNHVPYYNTEDFQSWALYNFEDITIKTWDNIKTHKKHFKDYIYNFTKDDVYKINKQKIISFPLGFQESPYTHDLLYDNYEAPTFLQFIKDYYT